MTPDTHQSKVRSQVKTWGAGTLPERETRPLLRKAEERAFQEENEQDVGRSVWLAWLQENRCLVAAAEGRQ